MANMEETLALYAAVAASAQSISEEMQAELVRLATKSSSAAGDKVLARLCVRNDASERVRKAAEKSNRAAVKAAWLSRTDHPAGYVEQAIATETRVTVLKAVAQHEDTTEQALEALASVDNKGVAMAILERSSGITDSIRAKAFTSVVRNYNSLSYRDMSVVAQLVAKHPESWKQAAGSVVDRSAMARILNSRDMHFPASELGRVAKTLLHDWRADYDPNAQNTWRSSGNQKLWRICQSLVDSPEWQEDSEEDQLVATVLHALLQTPAYGSYTATSITDCVNRFYGTDADRAAAEARKAKHAAEVHAARVSSDDALLTQYAERSDAAIQAALAENPHLRLKHLPGARSGALVQACLRNGDSRAVATGMQIAEFYYGDVPSLVDPLSEEERTEAVSVALSRLRERTSYMFAPTFARLLQVPQLTTHVLATVSVAEVVQVLESGYLGEAEQSLVTSTVAQTLAAHIASPEAWEMFSSLAGSIEGPIGEAARIASTV